MKFLIIFIYLINASFGYTMEKPNIKNLVLLKKSKIYEEVIFKDKNQKEVNLSDYKGKLLILYQTTILNEFFNYWLRIWNLWLFTCNI